MNPNHRKINLILLALVLITLLPIAMSWFFYSYPNFFKFKNLNEGVLIKNPISLQNLQVNLNQPQKWQLFYIINQNCNSQCLKNLFLLHQIRKALGQSSQRVAIILGELNNSQDSITKNLMKEDLQIIYLDKQQQNLLENSFKSSNQNIFNLANKVYLIDPHKNLFMYYPNFKNPMGILKDLKLLLKASQIG